MPLEPGRPRGAHSPLQLRLYRIGALILVAGLLAAGVVYLTATEDGGDVLGYEVAGGTAYAISPADSRRYLHDLELYGGKAAILADEFTRWFDGLWRGRTLAYTLAGLSLISALACFLAARQLSYPAPPGATGERDG